MPSRSRVLLTISLLLGCALPLRAEGKPAEPLPKSVEQVADAASKSIVVIRHLGRDGKQQGLGTGFVVAADGLIATNLHVIGEARPITVELADGKKYDVTSIHAFDRTLDLALVRIGAKGLTPLELGDSAALKDGQSVVAIGNPRGLVRSVVSGVVSGKREIDGRPMIQVAIPIEPGNSGGPLLDLQGRVHGLLTIKSLVTPNLGFAVAINSLKPLLKKPNPVPMSRWLTIGALDAREWKPQAGAHWRQRAGKIMVDGTGSGFGGRSLCLAQQSAPALPFEMAVAVRLDDEAGAAGLVFDADGGDRHFGFYPSAGQLRLARFDGPDVFSWKVLRQEPSPYYHPGEWNTLKVRLEKGRVRCFVNDHLAIDASDIELAGGKVGLAKFRATQAEFKHFKVAKKIAEGEPSAEVLARISKTVDKLGPQATPKSEVVDVLAPEGTAGVAVLRTKAKLLEEQAADLRRLALAVHSRRIGTELARVLQGKEEEIDLLHAALLIAKLDNEDLDVEAYRKEVERMAADIQARIPKSGDDRAKLDALNKYLFEESGFHGSRGDYYNRANSYLDEVIDDREGLPITLSVLYLDLARRLGLKAAGVALPGHFVVKYAPAKGDGQLIDVYEGAKPMTREEAAKKVEAITGEPLKDADLASTTKKAIVVRMLHNLLGNAQKEKDAEGMLRYLDAILAVAPEAAPERFMRAVLRYQTSRKQGALADADWLLERRPTGVDLDKVEEFRRLMNRQE